MKKTKILTTLTAIATSLAGCAGAIAIASCTPTGGSDKPKQPVATTKLNTTAAPVEIDLNSKAYPLTAKNTSSSAVTVNLSVPSSKVTSFKYKKGSGEEWTTEVDVTKDATFTLPAGWSVQFYAYNSTAGVFSTSDTNYYNIQFKLADTATSDDAGIVLGGNAMSLMCTSTSFDECLENLNDSSSYCFHGLYANSNAISSVANCFLPSTTMAAGCYSNMFNSCTNIQTAPALPAATLKDECYSAMFKGCSKLAVAPYLPATSLASKCYWNLFDGCSSLTSISLAYVGNFISKYFQSWTNNVSKEGKLFYNGSDTDKSTSEIPTNFTKVVDPYFDQHKSDLGYKEIELIPVSGKAKFKTTKNKVTWYCPAGTSDTIQKIIDDEQLLPTPVSSTDTDISYYDGTTYEQIQATTKLDAWPNRAIFNYGFNPEIIAGYTNIYSGTNDFTINKGTTAKAFGSLYYSEDKGITWKTVQFTSNEFKAKTNYIFKGHTGSTSTSDYTNLKITGKNVHVEGTLMSLYNNGASQTTISQSYAFYNLFQGSTGITTVGDNLLPATTLSEGCYKGLFDGCSNLTNAPTLKATSLPKNCYELMFNGCTNLKTVNEDLLSHVTSINESCCLSMFNGSGIKTTLTLPNVSEAKTSCYEYMFSNCQGLKTAPKLVAETLASRCYYGMFYGCTGMTQTMTDLPATTIPSEAYASMFQNCSSITATPTFHSVTEARQTELTFNGNACNSMFMGCSSLTDAKPLPVKSIYDADQCFFQMYMNCTSLEIAPCVTFCTGSKHQTPSKSYAYMFKGCTKLIVQYETWEQISAPSDSEIQDKHNGFFLSTCAYSTEGSSDKTWEGMFEDCPNADDGTPTSPQGWRRVSIWPVGHWDAFYSYRRDLTGLKFDSSSIELLIGKTTQLTATTEPKGAKTNLTWSSDKPEYVSVNDKGWVTAKKLGATATITVTDSTTGLKATCEVTPKDVSTEYIIVGKDSIAKGSKEQYEVQDKDTGEVIKDAKFIAQKTEHFELSEDGVLAIDSSATESSVTIQATIGTKTLSKTVTITEPTSLNNCAIATNSGKSATTCTISIESYNSQDIWYSINDAEFVQWIPTTTATITLEAGSHIAFKGSNPNGFSTVAHSKKTRIVFTDGSISLTGSIMGLIDNGTGTATEIPSTYCFYQLFKNNTSISQISSNFLPATTLKEYCYAYLFSGCSNLLSTTGMSLPANEVPSYAYSHLFYECTSLTDIPDIEASTVESYGCESMCEECDALRSNIPVLSPTTVGKYGYSRMFALCNNLYAAPELPATSIGDSAYNCMFQSCTSLAQAPELPATTIGTYAYYQMFAYCSAMTTGPSVLQFEASEGNPIPEGCCKSMFTSCTKLSTPPVIKLGGSYGNDQCFFDMFSNCGTALSITTEETEGIFFFECVFDSPSATCANMFNGTSGSIYQTPTTGTSYYYKTE